MTVFNVVVQSREDHLIKRTFGHSLLSQAQRHARLLAENNPDCDVTTYKLETVRTKMLTASYMAREVKE